jgi:hypothetical protein
MTCLSFAIPSRRVACLALAVAALSAPGVAEAQRTNRQQTAAARSLFERGLQHFDAHEFPAAAEAFQRSYDLRPSPVVGYNLASALRELGRLVDATEVLRAVVHAEDAPPPVAAAAQAMLDELEPRLGRLVIRVDGPVDSVELRIDERVLSSAVVGVLVPADPGRHRIVASRDGETIAEATVSITEGRPSETTLVVPPLPEPAVPDAREAARMSEGRMRGPLDQGEDDRDDHALRRNPWLWTGVGIVVVGGVLAAVLLATREPKPGMPYEGTLQPGTVTF